MLNELVIHKSWHFCSSKGHEYVFHFWVQLNFGMQMWVPDMPWVTNLTGRAHTVPQINPFQREIPCHTPSMVYRHLYNQISY